MSGKGKKRIGVKSKNSEEAKPIETATTTTMTGEKISGLKNKILKSLLVRPVVINRGAVRWCQRWRQY